MYELVKYLTDSPGKVNVAASGGGSNPGLWALAFQQTTGASHAGAAAMMGAGEERLARLIKDAGVEPA